MKDSGKTSNLAPLPAASAARLPSFSIVASRSRMTGSAWTQATVTGAFIAPLWPVCGRRDSHTKNRQPLTEIERKAIIVLLIESFKAAVGWGAAASAWGERRLKPCGNYPQRPLG